jgi:hypothetical protein
LTVPITTGLLVLTLIACNGSPTEPRVRAIAEGLWTGEGGVCLRVPSVNQTPRTAILTAGCGKGTFPTPDVRDDGTFEVEGTFRVEAGAVSNDPPPPAHYTGVLTNTTLTLTVTPTDPSAQRTTYKLHLDPNGSCGPACL